MPGFVRGYKSPGTEANLFAKRPHGRKDVRAKMLLHYGLNHRDTEAQRERRDIHDKTSHSLGWRNVQTMLCVPSARTVGEASLPGLL